MFVSHHVCSQSFFLLKVLPEPVPEQDEAHEVVAGDAIQPSGEKHLRCGPSRTSGSSPGCLLRLNTD